MELVYDNGYIMGCGLCVEGIAKGRYRRDALECASAWRRLTTRAQTLEYSISKKNHEETTSTIPQDDISYSQQSRNSDKNITSHLFLTPNLQNPNPHHRKKKKSHLINDIIIRDNLNLLRKVHTLAYL